MRRMTERERQELAVLINNGHNVSSYISDFDIRGEDLSGAILTGVDLSSRNISDCKFNNARMQNARLGKTIARNTQFVNCDLTNAELNAGDFRGSNFYGANLSHTKAIKADFRGVTWCKTTMTIYTRYWRGCKISKSALNGILRLFFVEDDGTTFNCEER